MIRKDKKVKKVLINQKGYIFFDSRIQKSNVMTSCFENLELIQESDDSKV